MFQAYKRLISQNAFTGAELYTKGFTLNSGKSENNDTVYLKLRCVDAVGSYSDLDMKTKVKTSREYMLCIL